MRSRTLLILLAITVPLSTAAPRTAMADAATCSAAKLIGLSRATDALLGCRARSAARALAVDPTCATQVDDRLATAFANAVALGGCATETDEQDVGLSLHAFDDDLTTALVTSANPDRCAAGKIRETLRRAKRELSCRRNAAASGLAYDPACPDGARVRLVNSFARRENRGTCLTTGDAPLVESLADDFLDHAAWLIDGGAEAPAPTGLAAVIVADDVNLTWTAPDPGSGLIEARVLRRLNTPPTGPFDGSAALVFAGSGEAAADDLTGLLPNTTTVARTWHYAAFACDISDNCEDNGSHTTVAPTVVQVLRAGGYVVHWRHASADVCSDATHLGTAETTAVPDWWKSCDDMCGTATARQLNTAGENESVAIGDAFATLGITVGRVLSSEFCRNLGTAVLMDFGPTIEESQDITYFVYDEAERCNNSFALLGEVPTAGTNTALIGHAGFTCPPLSQLAWAEAAIYKPDGMGGATFIERVLANAWLTLP
ncbi:MAG: hypothetical protein ABR538_13875 [Candidatus Binatia bacterium]